MLMLTIAYTMPSTLNRLPVLMGKYYALLRAYDAVWVD